MSSVCWHETGGCQRYAVSPAHLRPFCVIRPIIIRIVYPIEQESFLDIVRFRVVQIFHRSKAIQITAELNEGKGVVLETLDKFSCGNVCHT